MAVTLLVQVRFRPVCEPNGHLRPLRNTGVRTCWHRDQHFLFLTQDGPGTTRPVIWEWVGLGRGWAIPTYFVLTLLKIGWWCRAILCSGYCFVLYCIVLYPQWQWWVEQYFNILTFYILMVMRSGLQVGPSKPMYHSEPPSWFWSGIWWGEASKLALLNQCIIQSLWAGSEVIYDEEKPPSWPF